MQEKLLAFVMREYANSEVVPKAVLLQYLQYEYEVSAAPHPKHLLQASTMFQLSRVSQPSVYVTLHATAAANYGRT